MTRWYLLSVLLACYLLQRPACAEHNLISQVSSDTSPSSVNQGSENFTVFPVGLKVGKRNVLANIFVRGKEDGAQAVNFDNWLIPYDAVIQALKLKVESLPNGQLEVRSPGLITRIYPQQLINDPELGLVVSIKQLQTLFGVTAEFDINEYAINLTIPWLDKTPEEVGT
jgi:hypothetical protein